MEDASAHETSSPFRVVSGHASLEKQVSFSLNASDSLGIAIRSITQASRPDHRTSKQWVAGSNPKIRQKEGWPAGLLDESRPESKL